MPELPEVETIKNELLPYIVGHRITDVTLFWEGIVRQPSVKEFRSRLVGQEITGVARRGKYLLLTLTSVKAHPVRHVNEIVGTIPGRIVASVLQ